MNGQQNLFSESLYDYLFVIEPDLPTAEAVKQLKQLLHDRIVLSWANLNSKPHLSLFEFQTVESAEEGIIRKTVKALENNPAFPIELDGLVIFEHGKVSRSLVLKLKDPKPVTAVHAVIRKELHLKAKKLTPHVTIAGKIPVRNLDLLDSLEAFDYKGVFQCGKIAILKKLSGSKEKYSVLHEVTL